MGAPNKEYGILIEIDTDTGLPTGNTKPNVPPDPDFIPPFYDVACVPSTTTTTTTTLPVDSLLVEIQSLSSQVLNFNILKVSFQLYAYSYYSGLRTLLPSTLLDVTHSQTDDYLYIEYDPISFSAFRSVDVTVYYKVGSGTESVIDTFTIYPTISGTRTYLPIPRSYTGSSNRVRIVLVDTPLPTTTTTTSTTTTSTSTTSSTTTTTTAAPTTTTSSTTTTSTTSSTTSTTTNNQTTTTSTTSTTTTTTT